MDKPEGSETDLNLPEMLKHLDGAEFLADLTKGLYEPGAPRCWAKRPSGRASTTAR